MSWRKLLYRAGLALGVMLLLKQAWEICKAASQENLQVSWSDWGWGALLFSLMAYFVQVLAWTMIMRSLNVSMGLTQAIRGYFYSFLPRYIPGSVWGYWSRSEWLKQRCGINYAISARASVLETLALILTAFLLISVWFSLYIADLKRLALGTAFVGLLMFIWLSLSRLVPHFKCWRIKESLNEQMRVSFLSWAFAIILYLVLWCLHGGSVYLAGRAFLPTSSLSLSGAVFATTLAWLVGFIAIIVPAGIGVRELTFSTILSSYFNFLPGQASLIAIAYRFIVILAEVAWLLIGLALEARIK